MPLDTQPNIMFSRGVAEDGDFSYEKFGYAQPDAGPDTVHGLHRPTRTEVIWRTDLLKENKGRAKLKKLAQTSPGSAEFILGDATKEASYRIAFEKRKADYLRWVETEARFEGAPCVSGADDLGAAVEWLSERLGIQLDQYLWRKEYEEARRAEIAPARLCVKITTRGITEEGQGVHRYDSKDEAARRLWRQILRYCKQNSVRYWCWKPDFSFYEWQYSSAMYQETEDIHIGGWSVSCAFNSIP